MADGKRANNFRPLQLSCRPASIINAVNAALLNRQEQTPRQECPTIGRFSGLPSVSTGYRLWGHEEYVTLSSNDCVCLICVILMAT